MVDPEPPPRPPIVPPRRTPPADGADALTVQDSNPQQLASATPANSVDGSVFLARLGLILLAVLVSAAIFTMWRTVSYDWKDYAGDWHHQSYEVWQPLGIRIDSHFYTGAAVVLGVLAAAGFLLLLTALSLRQTRRPLAGRLAGAGAVLLASALLTLELSIHTGTGISAKKTEMELVALVGAGLLLLGCWRGLPPTKRNMLWCICSGLVIIAAVVGLSFIGTPHQTPPVPVLGQGFAGLIAGFALLAAGVIVAVKRGSAAGSR